MVLPPSPARFPSTVTEASSEFAQKYRPHVIPDRADEIRDGVFRWENEGSVVVMPTFWSDPTKANEEWLDDQRKGSTTDGFEREVLISFESWSGKRVYPEWNDSIHLSKRVLPFDPTLPILVGIDIPGPPAAVWGQLLPVKQGRSVVAHRLNILAELFMDGSIQEFGEGIRTINATRFPTCRRFKYVADPAAFNEISGTTRSAAQVLKEFCAIYCAPGPINLIDRTEPLRRWLKQLVPVFEANQLPGAFQLSPDCTLVRDGFRGGYCFKAILSTGSYKEAPEKNEFSHVMNALEYLVWAARPELEQKKDDMPVLKWKPEAVVASYE